MTLTLSDGVMVKAIEPSPVTLVPMPVVSLPGPPGPSGGDPSLYSFTNQATWTVTHNLGRVPLVELIDADGTVFDGDVDVTDPNVAVVTHAAPRTGSVLVL
jgi:hypothetical protein